MSQITDRREANEFIARAMGWTELPHPGRSGFCYADPKGLHHLKYPNFFTGDHAWEYLEWARRQEWFTNADIRATDVEVWWDSGANCPGEVEGPLPGALIEAMYLAHREAVK